MSSSPPILILHAPGTNRDGDLACAFELAGGKPTIAPLTALQNGTVRWQDFSLLALPGGFSYGDALGAGRLWALDLQTWFSDVLHDFVESGKPVIGICNGFQVLVKSGILPGSIPTSHERIKATLTFNQSGHFECRWVTLTPMKTNPSPWLSNLMSITCPVAHGEGRFILGERQTLPESRIALKYTHPDGKPSNGTYPINPNGSLNDIAGVTNARGNVIGMMPHPENHIYIHQNRQWTRGKTDGLTLKLFKNGLQMT